MAQSTDRSEVIAIVARMRDLSNARKGIETTGGIATVKSDSFYDADYGMGRREEQRQFIHFSRKD